MELLFLRHGMTEGNRYKRYIGVTDEPLCEEGRNLLEMRSHAFPEPDLLFVSPLLRCRETAGIIFPQINQLVIPDLAEMNFGIFENRSFQEDLKESPAYQAWIDSYCEAPIPEGESRATFAERCERGFERAMQIIGEHCAAAPVRRAAFVVHGGTIMSILHRYGRPERSYYEWSAANGHGYAGTWNGENIENIIEI